MINEGAQEKSKGRLLNLPDYPNLFIGRNFHLQSVSNFFQQDHIRLVTLLGPGGIGKTRLSVEVGKSLSSFFKDGVAFVPLDTINNYEDVPRYLGQVLQIPKQSNYTWKEEVLEFLVDKNRLLILDNLEQILETSGFIHELLRNCPQLKILATSRETLGLPEEMEYPLDGLSRPNPFLYPNFEDLRRFDAIEFFIEKARLIQPNFQINEDNAEAIIHICQLLDGLPLPLELAVARLKLFSPQIIWHKLQHNSKLLQSKSSRIIPRHQTISNTVKWSYDLLSADDQEVFQQLSIFRGGFSIEAIESIFPQLDEIELVESFLNKSLIVKGAEIQLVPRFRMLKLIRDFGWDLLDQNPKREVYLERFSNYFLDFLTKENPSQIHKDHRRRLELIEADYENIKITFSFFQKYLPKKAICLILNVWRFLLNKGRLIEGLELIESLLPVSKDNDKAALLEAAGTLAHNLGAYSKAKNYFEECLTLRKTNEEPVQFVKALNNIGWMAWRTGDYEECKKNAQKALSITASNEDVLGEATALNNKAWALFYQGYFLESSLLKEEVLKIYSLQDSQRQLAFAKVNLGKAFYFIGKTKEAYLNINRGIELFDYLKDQQLLAYSKLIKAEILYEDSAVDYAKELIIQECLPSFKKISDVWGIVNSYKNLGKIALISNDLKEADNFFLKVHDLVQRTDDKYGKAISQYYSAKIHAIKQQEESLLKYVKTSLALSLEMGANWLLSKNFQLLGQYFFDQKHYPNALYLWVVARFYTTISGSYQLKQFDHRYLKKIEDHHPFAMDIDLEVELLPSKEDLQEHLACFYNAGSKKETPKQEQSEKMMLPVSNQDPFMQKVFRLIHDNISNPDFKVEDLSKNLHLSSSHLHRKLDLLSGYSASKLIRQARLEKAKEMLANPQNTITAIAFETGFKDPDYFYRVFKKSEGLTPGAYRKKLEDTTE